MSRGPELVRVLAALVGLQALGLVGLAAFYAVELAVATPDDATRASAAALLTMAAGVGLGLVARGLVRRQRWARSPVVVTQLLVLPVAVGLVQGGRWYVGVPLLLWAAAVLALLFTPAVATTFESGDGE